MASPSHHFRPDFEAFNPQNGCQSSASILRKMLAERGSHPKDKSTCVRALFCRRQSLYWSCKSSLGFESPARTSSRRLLYTSWSGLLRESSSCNDNNLLGRFVAAPTVLRLIRWQGRAQRVSLSHSAMRTALCRCDLGAELPLLAVCRQSQMAIYHLI